MYNTKEQGIVGNLCKSLELSNESQLVLSCAHFRFWKHGLQAAERQKAGTTHGGSYEMTGQQPLFTISRVLCNVNKRKRVGSISFRDEK
jgi:hypothetical protein